MAEDTAPRMTYRERREARAERLQGWADKRQRDAAATFKSHERYRGDHAFNTQPGHIPERARVIAREERAFESMKKAEGMAQKAGGIEHQLDHAIYSDDEDAPGRLRERIEGLEDERGRIRKINAACRKAKFADDRAYVTALVARRVGDIDLTEVEAHTLKTSARIGWSWPRVGYPPYHLQNLGGNITRQKQRLAQLERDGGPPVRLIMVRYDGECSECGTAIAKGETAKYQRPDLRCVECPSTPSRVRAADLPSVPKEREAGD